jgi:hypothetical protein
MPARYNYSPDESLKKENYLRLLNELKFMIEQSQASDLNLSERGHLLTCSDCGTYEDITEDETLVVYDQDDEVLPYTEFILIDGKERIFEKKKPTQLLTTYTFMYQSAIIREKLEEDLPE